MSVRTPATISVIAGIPLAMGACALLGWWLGSLVDRALGTGAAFQVLLALLFVAGSILETVRFLRRSTQGPAGPRR